MNIRTILGAIVGAIALAVGAYFFGYSNAETKGELAMESLKKAQAEAIVAAQQEVKKDYERRMQTLAADLERVRSDNANRVQQLAKFRNADRDLAACRRDRERLAELAVEAESLLGEADGYLTACRR